MIPKFIDKSKMTHKPGVYIYKNSLGEIIYVGKAIDLYHRIASYFNNQHTDPKTRVLVENIRSLETIEVQSEIEALILEANLIKRYLPAFNIRLTDDKDYLYIKVTKEDFPKILTARKKELDDAKEFFGPFPSSGTVRSTLKRLRRVFPWCSNPPRPGAKSLRACFYYHLGLCPGVCIGKVDKKQYDQIINRFIKFMQGKKADVLDDLTKEMTHLSTNLDFERAAQVKKIINGIEYLDQPTRAEVYLENPNFVEDQNAQAVLDLKNKLHLEEEPQRIECYDISNLSGQFAVGSLVVLTGGDIDKKWYRKFKISIEGKPNDFAMMSEMVRRRVKHSEWPTPDLMLIDGGRGQVRAAEKEVLAVWPDMPIFGLAKRMEWLYPPEGEVIKLSHQSLGLKLLQKIRDEAHRVALTYHRRRRQKSFRD